MHKHRIRLAAAAILMFSAVGAQACEIWRDAEFGFWRGNCNLRDFKVAQSFIANFDHRLMLKLPDLHIKKFKYTVVDEFVTIEADVENKGGISAPSTPLYVSVAFGDPATGMQVGTALEFTVQVPVLTVNTTYRTPVATVSVPNEMQDWDLVVVGIADPSPSRGVAIESDEMNNTTSDSCRWFGPNPVPAEPCN